MHAVSGPRVRNPGLVQKREYRWRPLDRTEDGRQSRKIPEQLTPWSTTELLELHCRDLLQGVCESTVNSAGPSQTSLDLDLEGSRAFLKQRRHREEALGGLKKKSGGDERRGRPCTRGRARCLLCASRAGEGAGSS